MKQVLLTVLVAATLVLGFIAPAQRADAVITITLKSGINGALYSVQGEPGTAGAKGIDYDIGTYLAGGNGGKGHGFKDAYAFDGGHYCSAAEPSCFVSGPPAFTDAGGLEGPDHNWLQGTNNPIAVDLGTGNAADQAIVFNSLDHRGINGGYADPDKALWDEVIEGIEFTVYGTNDAADAAACASSAGRFLSAGGTIEAGTVPGAGTCSSMEKGALDYVFLDGWAAFGNTDEGDDFASVWQFSEPKRYVLVVSDNTDPFVGDGFQSFDNELDAIGRFLKDVGEPCPTCTQNVVGGSLLQVDNAALFISAINAGAVWGVSLATLAGIGIFFSLKKVIK